jgi:hypothetical protein
MTPLTKDQKAQFAKYQQEPEYQERVDKAKAYFCVTCGVELGSHDDQHPFRPLNSLTKVDLAHELALDKAAKEDLENLVKARNLRIEAIQQLMNVQLEDEGVTSFKLPDGRTFFQKQDVYVSVDNKEEFYSWLEANPSFDDLWSVNYQTASSLVKSRIQDGVEVPPGIKVFVKETIQIRRPT